MYAVIRTGGKQYRVAPGDRLRVERVGAPEVTLTPLLVVDGASVTTEAGALEATPVVARVVSEGRGKKIKAGKYKSKSRYYRRWGHRQDYSEIEIASIGDVRASAPAPVEEKTEVKDEIDTPVVDEPAAVDEANDDNSETDGS